MSHVGTAVTVEESAPALTSHYFQPRAVATVLAGVVGGGLGFLVIHWLHPLHPLPQLPELGAYPSAALLEQHTIAETEFRSFNGAMDCGILGGCLGLLVGLVASTRRRFLTAAAAGASGALGGALIGFVVGQVVAYGINHSWQQSLLYSTVYHALIWGVIGIAVNGAVVATQNPRQMMGAILAGIIGGVLGALAYNSLSSIMYPMSNLSIITPVTASERLLWIMTCVISLSLCLVFGLRRKQDLRATPR